MRHMFDRVRSMLKQYKNISNGRFDYRIYYPQNLDNIEGTVNDDNLATDLFSKKEKYPLNDFKKILDNLI